MVNKLKFDSLNNLIAHLQSLESDTLKVHTLMQYFLDNVAYDYTTLELANLNIDAIISLDDKYDASIASDRAKVVSILMHTHGLSKEAVDRILKNYGKEVVVSATPERVIMGKVQKAVPEHTIHCGLLGAYNQTYTPVKFKDGIITKGVCVDYAMFINQVCKKLGLDSHIVEGATPVSHVWNKIGNKNYDITYAMFIRDHYNLWHENAGYCDFLGVTDEKLQKIHPNRVTYSIDGFSINRYKDIFTKSISD